jgi:hypothetical protein
LESTDAEGVEIFVAKNETNVYFLPMRAGYAGISFMIPYSCTIRLRQIISVSGVPIINALSLSLSLSFISGGQCDND